MKNYIPHIIISVAIIAAACLLGRAYTYKAKNAETISVTGLSEVEFTSDLIVWDASYSRKAMTVQEAYAQMKADEKIIKDYLKEKGVKDAEISFSAVETNEDFDYTDNSRVFLGYSLTQYVTIESAEIDKIADISKGITELLDKGVNLKSNSPRYYYTKLNELKHDLLKQAAEDGKIRASKIAESAGSKLGDLKKANMGIFQITAQNGNEDYSWGGAFNTSSRDKTASITVKMEFKVD